MLYRPVTRADITLYVVSQLSAAGAGSTTLATVVQPPADPELRRQRCLLRIDRPLERRIEELIRSRVGK